MKSENTKFENTVLVVDNDPTQQIDLSNRLKSIYHILEASTIENARQLIKHEGIPDVIIIDIKLYMEKGNFYEKLILRERSEKIHSASRIPIIILANHSDDLVGRLNKEREQLESDHLYILDILFRPIDFDTLEGLLASASRRYKFSFSGFLGKLIKYWGPIIIVFFGFVLFWELITKASHIPVYLVPSPSLVLSVIISNVAGLMRDTGVTLLEAFLGFLLANVVSLLMAIGFCHSHWFEKSFYPYAIALKSVPVIAIAPLLIIWFGFGIMSKIIMAGIISFFPLVVNATLGLKSVDPEALELMHTLSASRRQILFKLRLPNALPYIFSALKVSAALSVVGAIIAEIIGSDEGLGYAIMIANYNANTPMLFATIVFASVAGIFFFGIVALTENIIMAKYGNYTVVRKE